MSENMCRICAKENQESEALKLFERKNRNLLVQLKDLTGVMLKNSIGLPKLLCNPCHQSLIDAHKFREDFLTVQASFNIKLIKPIKKLKGNGLIEATEFVQVFIVKEEKDKSRSDPDDENTDEKEINLNVSHVPYKKDNWILDNKYKNEINALELKPNEENTLEDTKIPTQDDKLDGDVVDNKLYSSKISSDDEDVNFPDNLSDRRSDEDFIPATPPKKAKTGARKKKQPKSKIKIDNQTDEKQKETPAVETKISKPRKKRKDAEEHPDIYMCDQCGNHFTCRYHFKLHLRRHTGDKQCACELCPDKFFTSSELRRHMRKHTGERPFACKFCDRRFTDYSTRIKHERTHTNERPFICSQCGKSFTTAYILKNHMLTHTGERHFKCDVCNRAFTRRTHLIVHNRSIMHKQAVEKDKQPISHQELPQPQCLIPPPTQIPSFLV